MKKALCVLSAVLVVCGLLVLGPAAQAKAECTTQGALALALAEMLKFDVTTTEAAVAALVAIGVEPNGGWKPEECLTPETTTQIRDAYARAVADSGRSLSAGAVDGALEALKTIDRQLQDVSPSRP